MKRIKEVVLIVFLIAIVGTPRFIGIGKFVSLDEPFWLNAGANFYYALGQHQFEKTIIDTPAVTTLWSVTGGMLYYFREYRGGEQGYLKRDKFIAFFSVHDKTLLQLLIDSRILQTFAIIILFLTAYKLLDYLLGQRSAFLSIALVSLSPYFLGHSRLLNHEALMGLFLLVSLLSMTAYLFKGRKVILLILSAVAGALAQLSKSSALPLFLSIGVIYIFYLMEIRRKLIWNGLSDAIKTLGGWFIVLVAAYTVFWPGMWVAPGRMLYEVYGNAFSYAFKGAQLQLTQNLQPSVGSLSNSVGDIRTFVAGMIWRTTPFSWFGFAFGTGVLFTRTMDETKKQLKWITVCLLLTASLYILVFGIAKGRNSPHYILTSYICVEMIAGLGWVSFIELLAKKWSDKMRRWMVTSLFATIIAFEAISAVGFYPYYYTYYNPLMEAVQPGIQNPTLYYGGYGEGLEQAAAYLAQKPHADKMTVMSFYGYGCFSFFFPGQTVVINYMPLLDVDSETLKELEKTGYVVINYRLQKQADLLEGFDDVKPEKVIWLNGIEYIHIYRTSDLLARLKVMVP